MSNLVLSVFPGIDLLGKAFEEEGFCIVRGPDVLWGGDIRAFHPPSGIWGGIMGGPPCQSFSALANLVRAKGYEPRFGNLIPEFERVVSEALPAWFLMENVVAAPRPVVPGYAVASFVWNNGWLPGEKGDGIGESQQRRRMFSFGVRGACAVDLRRWMPQAAWDAPTGVTAVVSDLRTVPVKIGGSGKVKRPTVTQRKGVPSQAATSSHAKSLRYTLAEACELQGLPRDFLEDAPFTAKGKLQAVANGVALPTGRAIAGAIKKALETIGR